MLTPPPAEPRMLIIDDEPHAQGGPAAVLRRQGLEVLVRSPEQVTGEDLVWADIMAIDQYYDTWTDSDPRPVQTAFSPPDGLALAGVVARHRQVQTESPPVIVMRTGHLDRLTDGLPRAARVPMLSSQYNIDWMLAKDDSETSSKLIQLTQAAAALLPIASMGDQGAAWLNVPEYVPWHDVALFEVAVCRPPEHSVANYTRGAAWLRWFAHEVLPFPTFLVSDMNAAMLLGLSEAEFQRQTSGSASPLGSKIKECRYTGHLSGLVGRRWWRAGLESLVEELTIDAPYDLTRPEMFTEAYQRLYRQQMDVLQVDHPVIAIDPDYEEIEIAEAADCLRLAPDFWPAFADEPWALRRDLEEDSDFAELVARGDRGRLSSMGAQQ